jgi:hypothetical protein
VPACQEQDPEFKTPYNKKKKKRKEKKREKSRF